MGGGRALISDKNIEDQQAEKDIDMEDAKHVTEQLVQNMGDGRRQSADKRVEDQQAENM
jgi:hypothetical protein